MYVGSMKGSTVGRMRVNPFQKVQKKMTTVKPLEIERVKDGEVRKE